MTDRTLFTVMPLLAAILATTAGCYHGGSDGNSAGSGSGQGGSMARFTINGDYLYTVDDNTLKVVSIAEPANPLGLRQVNVGANIETIFRMDDYLFIGSQGAMFIYDISRPAFPDKLSTTNHFRSCDPVVAWENFAFVTLNSSSGRWCGSRGDLLLAFDITDVKNPKQLGEDMRLSSPRGLAVDGEAGLLFVCEKGGVSAFEFSESQTPGEINIEGLYMSAENPDIENIDAYDCIVLDGNRLLVIGSDGLYQLGYGSDGFTLTSEIAIDRKQ